jgi:Tfp pilus assembly protein FimV
LIVKYINFLLVCLVGLSINAYSLQLGKIILKSNQNSPLDVSIQVNLSSEDKIDLLKPSIAPKENYDSQGIMRTKIHNDIVLSLIPKNSKQATLRLTSKIPVTEPFLDLLIQVESTSGKILKEYTVLLDPPTNLSPRKKTQEKKIIKSENQGKKNPEKLKKVDSKKIVEKKSNIKASKKKKTVKAIPGKTLFQIARDNPLAGITTEQIVISIYQLNPSAFDGNLNGLIKGKTLNYPCGITLKNYLTSKQEKYLNEKIFLGRKPHRKINQITIQLKRKKSLMSY